jgi:hypothetical protein
MITIMAAFVDEIDLVKYTENSDLYESHNGCSRNDVVKWHIAG